MEITHFLPVIDRNRDMSLAFWDALVVEATLRGSGLLTEDLQHVQRIENLSVEGTLLEDIGA
jgi:predicted nucleic acid-binding protein